MPVIAPCIKNDVKDIAIIGKQFCQLVFDQLDFFWGDPSVLRITGNSFGPVTDGIIESNLESTQPKGIHKFSYHIAPASLSHCVIRIFTRPHAKTVVMFGSQHSKFHSGTFGSISPLTAIQFFRIHQGWTQIIRCSKDSIFALMRRSMIGHQLIRQIQIGSRTKMDKHAKTKVYQIPLQFRQ